MVRDDNKVVVRDLINQLPDDILVNILSLLTFKEAGQTSILSTRWRYLWTSHPNLNFDASRILYNLRFNVLNIDKEDEKKLQALEKRKYLNWVNQVVRSHTGPTIHEFAVQFPLTRTESSYIDEWIHFAFKMNVQRLILDFVRCYTRKDRYIFPDITVGFHHILRGNTSSLTSLKLTQINVTGEVLQFFLSACPLLECLVVHQSTTVFYLEVSSTSLKSLELRFCHELKNVLVTAPNLMSFEYFGHKTELQLIYCPKLTKLSLGGYQCNHFIHDNPMEFFSNYLSQVEVLILEIHCMFFNVALHFPVLASVKRLEVSIDPDDRSLIGFASMIKACPLLRDLSFKIHSPEPTRRSKSKVAICPHQSLKVVELVGFVGPAAKHLASYLVKNAVNLEKIIFDTRDPAAIGTPYESAESEERKDAVIHAQYLVKELRPGVESVII